MTEALPADHMMGANNPPEEMVPEPDVSGLPPLEGMVVLVRARVAPKVKAAKDFAAGRPTVVTADTLEAAAKFVKDGRVNWKDLDELRVALKTPYDVASRAMQDTFKGALDELEAAGKAVNRLIGEHNERVAEEERKRANEAALAAKLEADRRLAVADSLLDAGLDDAASGVAESGLKLERQADQLTKQASGSVADLARTRTHAGTVSSKVEYSETIDFKVVRKKLGKLGEHFTAPEIEKAVRAFRTAELKASRQPELPGVAFNKGSIGVVR